MSERNQQNCCSKLTKLEKCLIFLLLVLICGFCLVEYLTWSNKNANKNVCQTLSCVSASYKIKTQLDESANPCDNFYKFACGNFPRYGVEHNVTIPLALEERSVRNRYNSLIMSPPKQDDPLFLQEEKKFFKKCLNTSDIDKDNNTSVRKVLEELGGWPLLSDTKFNETEWDYYAFMGNASKIGVTVNSLFNLGLYEESYKYLKISHPPDVTVIDQNLQSFYLDFMADVALALSGGSRNFSYSQLQDVLSFENNLGLVINKTIPKKNPREAKPEFCTLKEFSDLEEELPQVNWLNLINNITGIQFNQISNVTVVALESSNFTIKVAKLFGKTSKRTLANYSIWRILYNLAPFLSEPIRTKYEMYRTLKSNQFLTRTRFCLRETDRRFHDINLAYYVKKHISNETHKDVSAIVSSVQKRIVKHMEESTWLDKESQARGLEKIDLVESVLGVPDSYLEEDFETIFGYNEFKFNSTNILHMILEQNKHQAAFDFSNIHEEGMAVAPYFPEWLAVNGRYLKTTNVFMLPIPMFEDYFYSKEHPMYLNYGSIGLVTGHELSHGFDDPNVHYLSEFGLQKWLSNASHTEYAKRVSCVVEEYNRFHKTSKLPANASSTLNENIADFIGIDLAYEAYQDWLKENKNKQEQLLPGMEQYSPNQLFWMKYASMFCFDLIPGCGISLEEIQDDHSTFDFRIVAPLRHSKYFAKDFKCPIGSQMNPKDKCDLL